MNLYRIIGWSIIGLTVSVDSAFAQPAVPGPIAGIGLPALALIGGAFGGAYWIGRKVTARKNKK